MDTKIINAENAPAAVGPYCHAEAGGDFVFTSGQIGLGSTDTGIKRRCRSTDQTGISELRCCIKSIRSYIR